MIYGIDGVGKSLVELVGYLATCWAGGASLLRVDEHGSMLAAHLRLARRIGFCAGRLRR